jgi:hypothetical protein
MEILENKEQWSAYYHNVWVPDRQATGKSDWSLYQKPKNEWAPGGPGVKLSQSRLMLISSAGGYLPASQQPFDAASPFGDYTLRTFPSDTPFETLAFTHDHYPHDMIDQDAQVALPLGHLAELVRSGSVGSLTPSVASIMGYMPDAARVVDELVPQVVALAKQEAAEAALLAPL